MTTRVRTFSRKACAPIVITLSGMITLVRPLLRNALFPIVITLSGITTTLINSRPKNALSLIAITRAPLISDGITRVAGQVPEQPLILTLDEPMES